MYYVYLHRRLNGTVFYVGKGTNGRAWSKHGRSKHWNSIVAKENGFSVEIVSDQLQEWYAFELETEVILRYGLKRDGGTLVNMTYGGEGSSGNFHTIKTRQKMSASRKGIKHHNADKTVYRFVNLRTKEEFVGDRHTFKATYGINPDDLFVSSKKRTVFAWALFENVTEDISPHYDPNEYHFKNIKTGQSLKLTRQEFKKQTGVNSAKFFTRNDTRKTVQNWQIVD